MFVFDTLMESIKREVHCITGPVYIAKEKLEKLSKVNVTTNLSGYESQFKVILFQCELHTYALYVLWLIRI